MRERMLPSCRFATCDTVCTCATCRSQPHCQRRCARRNWRATSRAWRKSACCSPSGLTLGRAAATDIGNVISNLSRLSSDLEQFSAVLSVNALRPSPLSNLPSEDIEQLIAQQRRALELALSRIALTCSALLAGEPLRADGKGITAYRELATLMRRSKSIAQALATNLYWQQRMQDAYEDDLSARLYAAVLGKESET